MPSRPKGRFSHSRRKPASMGQTRSPGEKKGGVPRAIEDWGGWCGGGEGEEEGEGKGKARSFQRSDWKGH